MDSVNKIISKFQQIELEQLSDSLAEQRFETKFFFHDENLNEVLSILQDEFSLITIHNLEKQRYHSLYLDTKDYINFQHHHNKSRPRYKVRYRTYVDSGDRFLEVKCKNNKSKTLKYRLPLVTNENENSESRNTFIKKHVPFDPELLQHGLITEYDRYSLISKERNARITIDTNLKVEKRNRSKTLNNLVVLEMKYNKDFNSNRWVHLLSKLNIHHENFSKYCVGLSLLNSELKQNNFKMKLKKINDIIS